MHASAVRNSTFVGVLGSSSILNPKSAREKRTIIADLLLTALIDAFSILVIFLLMSFSSTGDILFISKDTQLPKARNGVVLERYPVLKVEPDGFYLEGQKVTLDQLVPALLETRKKFQENNPGVEFPGILTLQADRRVKFDQMNPVIVASSNAGFSDIKFAILME